MKITLDNDDLLSLISEHLTAKFGNDWEVELEGSYSNIRAECKVKKAPPIEGVVADDIPF